VGAVRRTAAAAWQSLPAERVDAAVSRTLQSLENHRPLACSPSPLHAAVWSAVLASLPPVLQRRVVRRSHRAQPSLPLAATHDPAQRGAPAVHVVPHATGETHTRPVASSVSSGRYQHCPVLWPAGRRRSPYEGGMCMCSR
jgi:hypothetical protein